MAQKIRQAEGVLRAIPKPGEAMYERVLLGFAIGRVLTSHRTVFRSLEKRTS